MNGSAMQISQSYFVLLEFCQSCSDVLVYILHPEECWEEPHDSTAGVLCMICLDQFWSRKECYKGMIHIFSKYLHCSQRKVCKGMN